MNKLVIYLHGFGNDYEHDNPKLQKELSQRFNCDVVGIIEEKLKG